MPSLIWQRSAEVPSARRQNRHHALLPRTRLGPATLTVNEPWMLDPAEALTVIEFEFLVDGMIEPDGRVPIEVQAASTDAIEPTASEAAGAVGARVIDVRWSVSRRRRT